MQGADTQGISRRAAGRVRVVSKRAGCEDRAPVRQGRWYYEVVVVAAGQDDWSRQARAGWALGGRVVEYPTWTGVGDVPRTYAVGLQRTGMVKVAAAHEEAYSKRAVQAGDVIGVGLDADAGTMSVWVNGQPQVCAAAAECKRVSLWH